MQCWSIILAAGSGSRMAQAAGGVKKQFIRWNGAPLFWQSAVTLARVARLHGLVFVFPRNDMEEARAELEDLDRLRGLGLPWLVTEGGERRQDSVYNGLMVLPEQCDTVLVHDAARPFLSAALVNRLLDALQDGARGVIPVLPVTDTIKVVTGTHVVSTPVRDTLRAVQTPQGFERASLLTAHEACRSNGWQVTDDASVLEQAGISVSTVAGDPQNHKITHPEDLVVLGNRERDTADGASMLPVVGWGYDVHRYGAGRPMKLGGVPIPGAPEVVAHSDGDVLLHALTDALLGCMGGGDIGEHFPDTAAEFDNIESGILLNEVYDRLLRQGIMVTHVDVTVIAQVPKVSPWKPHIRKNLCRLLKLAPEQVNVKATTEEKLGFTGEKKGIKAVATVTAIRPVRAALPQGTGQEG